MINKKFLGLILVALIVNTFTETQAQNWSCWRGPNGDGTTIETDVPVSWDSVKNVVWKSPIPGKGHSSPIVWENKLFLTTATEETQEKMLLCYDNTTGELLWQKTVVKDTLQRKHPDNSYASGTPATDGKLVYLSFLDVEDIVVAAYDFSGNQVWIQRPGKFSSPHGYSCSPVLFQEREPLRTVLLLC